MIKKLFFATVFAGMFIFFSCQSALAKVVTEKFYADSGDGRIQKDFYDWQTAHDSEIGNDAHWPIADWLIESGSIASGWENHKFLIRRGYFPINTKNLSENVNILSANLFLNISDFYDLLDDKSFLVVVHSSQLSNSKLYYEDYGKCGEINYPTEGSDRLMIQEMIIGDNYWSLNQNGLSWITRGGYTFIGLREGHDVLNYSIENLNQGTHSGVLVNFSETPGIDLDPYLEITYEIPDEPEENNFTFVHLTDPHIGANWAPGHKWHEELSYPRLADALYAVSNLAGKPDFALIGGDLVEYSDSRWWRDYAAMLEGWSAQTGINAYFVPGNHDRYQDATGNVKCGLLGLGEEHCDDNLAGYHNYLSQPGLNEENYLLPGDSLNYSFTHKDVRFIGLDTGADYIPDYEYGDGHDQGPEGAGLSDEIISALNGLDPVEPKIILTHHPLMTGFTDACTAAVCPYSSLSDASFVQNYSEFLDFVNLSNVRLVLSGHTHDNRVFDQENTEYLYLPEDVNPLFIQTPSATKDGRSPRAFREISVQNGSIQAFAPVATPEYPKKIVRLSAVGPTLRYYDPVNNITYVTPADQSGLSVPFFGAPATNRLIIFDADGEKSESEVAGAGGDAEYDWEISSEGGNIPPGSDQRAWGFYLNNSPLSFISLHINSADRRARVFGKNINISGFDTHRFTIDWSELISNQGKAGILLSFDQGGNGIFESSAELIKLPGRMTAILHSPAGLHLVDAAGRMTGSVQGETKEEIPLALYLPVEGQATVYFQGNKPDKELRIEVIGQPDPFKLAAETYALDIHFDYEDEEIALFQAAGIPIKASTTHQYRVDWDKLQSGQAGVMVDIDREGDGIFEQTMAAGKIFNADTYRANLPQELKKEAMALVSSINFSYPVFQQKAQKAKEYISLSLDDKYWQDEIHLNKPEGYKVFFYESLAAKNILAILSLAKYNKKYSLPAESKNSLEKALKNLVTADRIIFQVAWTEMEQKSRIFSHGQFFRPVNNFLTKFYQEYNLSGQEVDKLIKNFGKLWKTF
ncbi:hypothetical protein COX69_01505 [Candidatus Falkowbacteria bacterium CG_4_10_14_0_2_um_filter_48_10]|nr:MAG: hypothetical protein COX69_01505 [Candidatus Falkowbacteria bacterium CG_4_10_14_0_2_um_filter_48_10]